MSSSSAPIGAHNRLRGTAIIGLLAFLVSIVSVGTTEPNAQALHDHSAPGHSHGTEHVLGAGDHEASEGPVLAGDASEHTAPLRASLYCEDRAPVRYYDLTAIPVVITVNRWGDNDPGGYMFVETDQISEIRAQERLGERDGFGLTAGVGADAIQPIVLRANPGDCVQVEFTNLLDAPVSFHVHGADLTLAQSGESALASNPDSYAHAGSSVAYEWFVDREHYSENTHFIHGHGAKARHYENHGLFGAFIIEPPGSEYLDQRTGEPLCETDDEGRLRCSSTWDAIISPGTGSDFREFSMIYHEFGNPQFSMSDKNGMPNPIIDPIAGSYKPNAFAINYRSESFWRRLGSLDGIDYYQDWGPDKAETYSSYVFGEPATPIPQAYLGDPVKFRLSHGGTESLHVPHLHGGGIQWQRQPDLGKEGAEDYIPIDAGLKKEFASTMPGSATDSQSVGPSETYDIEIGCGSGGCQQGAGDYLFHCHVASHYISGMWHFSRVYNTLQDGPNKTDDLSVVAELPDRTGRQRPAVTSDRLLDTRVEFAGQTVDITREELIGIVESQLPPRGVPKDMQDASVLDWQRDGLRYLNEPETTYIWPNFASPAPGNRHPLLFNPDTAQLAFPFLRPHLGKRPPFAPRHGPAPFLEPRGAPRAGPAQPGSNGDSSLCPAGAPTRNYKIHAISTDIPVTSDKSDSGGMIFVLKEHEDRARSDPDFKVPLAVRANQGDCVDILFVNELDEPESPKGSRPDLMKTNMHIHFVQFDVQASDGVIAGGNFEQAVRPIDAPGVSSRIVQVPYAGANWLLVDDASVFQRGATVAVGVDQDTGTVETATVRHASNRLLVFKDPLANRHVAGEMVSTEFVRYRYYVARQNGAIYFHDHVDALVRWGHGLFGALIAEPRGATYHDPRTGEEITSGPIADIRNDGESLPGLDGGFREFVLFMTDRNPLTGSSINLRAEPLHADTTRGAGPPDEMLSSLRHDDPHTPLLNTYPGDPVVFRLLTSATEEVHAFHLSGHRFRKERFREDSPGTTAVAVGISERFNAYVDGAGGSRGQPGDYVYYNGAQRHFREGSWGILRVHDSPQPDLQPLPDRTPPTSPPPVCPADAPDRTYRLTALQIPIAFNAEAGLGIPSGRLYVLSSDVSNVLDGSMRPEPLVIRANQGECLTVVLTNRMPDQPATFHVDALAFDPRDSQGITLGLNPPQAAEPGESVSYRYFVDADPGAVLVRDFGNPMRNPREGLYGALIVEPAGSAHYNLETGTPGSSGISAAVVPVDDEPYREFVMVFQDNDPEFGMFTMPYAANVERLVGVNYRSAPLSLRTVEFGMLLDGDPVKAGDQDAAAAVFDSDRFGDPETDVFESYAGDRIRLHIVSAYGEQSMVFSLEGHQWRLTPELEGSDVVSSRLVPPTGSLDVDISSAGGPSARSGDYLWSNHRLPYLFAGQWGILRVFPDGAPDGPVGLDRLSDSAPSVRGS